MSNTRSAGADPRAGMVNVHIEPLPNGDFEVHAAAPRTSTEDAEVAAEVKSRTLADHFEPDDIEAVAACLGDDAAQLRQENDEDERAANMDRAASMLTWMLLTHPEYADDDGAEASDRLIRAVFLDLLGQVRAFIEAEGEANFWTGPAEALRWTLKGKTPPSDLQSALAKFILRQGNAGVGGLTK